VSTVGVWLAMFPRERTPSSLGDLAAEIGQLEHLKVRSEGDKRLVVTVFDTLTNRTADFTIGLNDEPHVIVESAEIAEQFGAERPDRDDIAKFDARFELVWSLDNGDETYNPMLWVSEILQDTCGAVVFDTVSGAFI
jgi:hypothetical protein